ncbi:hypothetical protein GOZ94_01800 [Agrobacterium vitis]|uniref:excalibur calcium-binding domain-containing protein n=1 Tax=Agrobacterium vitis TaxID=373 RepID=UPI0012E88A16|nr:hypothetical protein [Agrobacterium vitis]
MASYLMALAILPLASCANVPTSDHPASANVIESIPTETLWIMLSAASSDSEMSNVEAELASRHEMVRGTEYVGRRTGSSVGTHKYPRLPSQSQGLNCSNFASPAAAQRYFLLTGGPATDVNGLDRDGDGFACEFGSVLKQNKARFSFNPSAQRRHTTVEQNHCYVGPRGGTYTITASGRKNYGGC